MEATIVSELQKHYPVLLKEIISVFSPQHGGTFIDCTFGQGGYSKKILDFENTSIIALDRDVESEKIANKFKENFEDRFIFKNIKFSQLNNLKLKNENIRGVIFDLGYSYTQIKDPQKGLSFEADGKLNMQLGLNSYSAEDAINKLDEKELEKIFKFFGDEKEAKQIAVKRTQLVREQSVRTQKHITLDEIGRRIAIGEFKELNIILKGDVDGSVEALTDSFQKLSTDEIVINIIHKAVGAITESDVLLASASDAIIIGFNVRPTGNARQIADKEEIDIRNYSIIYDAINDLKDAMEGMLAPKFKEEITGNAEIRETFKISKVGTIAGCMVTSGKIFRNSNIRIIREGVVITSGTLASLKRFKDDAKEVSKGYDCGIQIKNYNDIKIGDIIEAYSEVEIKKKIK